MYGGIVVLDTIYSVFGVITIAINPILDYHQKNIHLDNFFEFFNKFGQKIAHNVSAVHDLAARIRKCVAFPGPTNCGGDFAWEWSAAE
jgi:hypothetical protein